MLMRFVVVSLVLVGCGPTDGSPCKSDDKPVCGGADVSHCESGQWVSYACPGVCGSTCDWSKAKDGYRCPKAFEGYSKCNGTDTLVTCLDGKFFESPCGRCVETSERVICG